MDLNHISVEALKEFLRGVFQALRERTAGGNFRELLSVISFRGLQVKPAPDERRFVPGSATRVPAGRKCCDLIRGNVSHRKQTRCAKLFFCVAATCLSPQKKEGPARSG
jgi:hypothetical protein